MKRKGLFETIALAVVTLMLISTFSVLGTQLAVDMNQIVRRETVGLAASRVSSTMYAADALDRANVQLHFPYNYTMGKNSDGELTLSYTYNDKTNTAVVPSEKWIEDLYISDKIKDEKSSKDFCLKKRPGSLTLEGGRCG
ncbi:MAG: hypothetical protein ABEJ93_01765 [Candidatus Nanohalobium sp.]